MKVSVTDLKLAMSYIEKEKVQSLEVVLAKDFSAELVFIFNDAEGRECQIKCFSSEISITPELTKKMKLYSRVP